MKVLILGNCQARPVSRLLGALTGADCLEPIVLHLAKPDDETEHRARLDQADLILAQQTSEIFEPSHLRSGHLLAERPGKVLVWPNIFYSGQQPYLRYVTLKTKQQRVVGPLGAYHDARLLKDWYEFRGEAWPWEPLPETEDVHRQSLSDIRNREATCDIKVSDFIDSHWQTDRLTFTFNHPSRFLLEHVCREIAKVCGLNTRNDLGKKNNEPLGKIVPPSDLAFPSQESYVGVKLDSTGGIVMPISPQHYSWSELRQAAMLAYDKQTWRLMQTANLRLTPGSLRAAAGSD